MNKLNTRLLTVFLISGIVFFALVAFMLVSEEIISKAPAFHTIKVESINILKNDLADTSKAASNRYSEPGTGVEIGHFNFLNTRDSFTYIKSTDFDVINSQVPYAVYFNERPPIPSSTNEDIYRIILACSGNNYTFEPFVFAKSLQLENKKDDLTQYRDIKLTSVDKKLTIMLNLVID